MLKWLFDIIRLLLSYYLTILTNMHFMEES